MDRQNTTGVMKGVDVMIVIVAPVQMVGDTSKRTVKEDLHNSTIESLACNRTVPDTGGLTD